MPEIDGLETTRLIRNEEEKRGDHVPIIAMTAHAMSGDKERCLDAGMDGYVSKPINAEELFELIERLMDKMRSDEGSSDARFGGHILDEERLFAHVAGDKELLHEIFGLFQEDYPVLLNRLHDAVQTMDWKEMREVAHAIRGSVANFAANTAVETALKLEKMEIGEDTIHVEEAASRLEKELQRLERVLQSICTGKLS